MQVLRDYQQRAVEWARSAIARDLSVLLVAPTGAGKGTIAAHVLKACADKGKRGLFVVHRGEIVRDVRARLAAEGVEAGIHTGADTGGALWPIQVATIQTLTARGHSPPAELIVVDEAHHVTASTYRALLERYPSAKVLGLTATPERRDKTALGNVFKQLHVVAQVGELVERGVLCPIDVVAPPDTGGLAMDPVDAYQQWGSGGSGLVFLPTVKESKALTERFLSVGVPTEHLDGKTPPKERKAILDRLASGETRLVCNVFVLTEGVDIPHLSTCLLVRGCGSAGLFLQMVGRVRRFHPGKERCTLIDLQGACRQVAIGHPDDDRHFSLSGKPIQRDKPEAVSQCPKCGLVVPSLQRGPECRRCGFVFPVQERQIEERPRSIGKITPNKGNVIFQKERFVYWCGVAARKALKPGFVAFKFKEEFGFWPTWDTKQGVEDEKQKFASWSKKAV